VIEAEGTIEKRIEIQIQGSRRRPYVEEFCVEGQGKGVFIRPVGSDLEVDQIVLRFFPLLCFPPFCLVEKKVILTMLVANASQCALKVRASIWALQKSD